MTKNEIIRELRNCRVDFIERLFIVYHNGSTPCKYVFEYENTLNNISTYDERRELARVLLSIYRLRRYVDHLHLVYSDCNGNAFEHIYDSVGHYVFSVSDFIKTIKK